jgi:hypothetical protein
LAPIAPKLVPVAAQIPVIAAQLAAIVAEFARPGRRVAPVPAIFPAVTAQLTVVLPEFPVIPTDLPVFVAPGGSLTLAGGLSGQEARRGQQQKAEGPPGQKSNDRRAHEAFPCWSLAVGRAAALSVN